MAEGIGLLRVDTPFLVGPVNVWLIEDDPLTLVDTGANTGTTLLQLRSLLAERGHGLADVGRIVVTHQHLDHMGLAGPLAAISGAEVVGFTGMDAYLADGPASALREERFDRDLMRHHGTSEDTVLGWWAARPDTRGFASEAPDVRTVADGDVLEFAGRTLHVHHRPGHSPSDLVLHDRERGTLLVGDHLLDGHPPVPVIHPPLPGAAPLGLPDPASPAAIAGERSVTARGSALLDLRASLRRTRGLGAAVALTGHGDVVPDIVANVDRRLAEHDAAAERLLAELVARGPGSAGELRLRVAPNGRSHPFFGLCDVLGTLDQLVDEGAATTTTDDGPPRYAAR
ncbi:MBL fold metallo-hydrolase [Patulibacter minatonensis]|uniref:MBL fold metallo-hydrolase n=1 Tax=Patulibacter minatonensis TaxID=298163 RepID=UPI000479912C|nr:MBL fold metallo-hydrolase [Patulibacter minatonensis]